MTASAQDFAGIEQALQQYFDGLYHSDSKKLSGVFHPQAIYASATDAKLNYLTMAEYFRIVDKRPAPATQNQLRVDRIISIEFAGPVTAFARVECAIGAKFFTDFLTFVRISGRWQIMAKVFHYDLRENI